MKVRMDGEKDRGKGGGRDEEKEGGMKRRMEG